MHWRSLILLLSSPSLKSSCMNPPYPSHIGWQVDSEVKDMGYFYMFREKVINSDLLILHILVLSWIEPNQGQNASPWA